MLFFYYNYCMKFFKSFIVAVLISFTTTALCACGGNIAPRLDIQNTLGVWWWDNRLDSSYLEFAVNNGVDEIYYYTSTFSENNRSFIQSANSYDVSVYWLTGEYTWIENPQDFHSELEKYISFQENSENTFSGVHLDVEPHQHPNFEERREELIGSYISFIYNVTTSFPNISFDLDIPFWLDDIITFNGQTKEAYKFLIDYADRTFIMSYRDSAEKIFDVAREELEYSSSVNKPIFLGVETGDEEDVVTFNQESKSYMYSELNKLSSLSNLNFGVSIHHIKTWSELKNY